MAGLPKLSGFGAYSFENRLFCFRREGYENKRDLAVRFVNPLPSHSVVWRFQATTTIQFGIAVSLALEEGITVTLLWFSIEGRENGP